MLSLSGVVKHLIVINVLVFVVTIVNPQTLEYLALYPPFEHPNFSPYQLITHMFTHAGPMHIMFNMLMLYFLGPWVEKQLGPKRFLILYLTAGVVAMIAHVGLGYLGIIPPSIVVGASGATMGVLAAFALIFPNVKLMLLIPPIPIKAKYLVLVLIAIDLFSGVSGGSTGIAHFAHLGGVLGGFLLIMYWKENNLRL